MSPSDGTQSYANHGHRPWPAIIALMLAAPAAVYLFGDLFLGWHADRLGSALLAGAVLVLISVSRRNTTALQDRIIRLEMRLRLERLLPAAQQAQVPQLTLPQLVALRFAGDAEMPALVDRAVREHLTSRQIKQAIVDWQPDFART